MLNNRFGNLILFLILLTFVSGCSDSLKVKINFDEVASGTGSSQNGGSNPSPAPARPNKPAYHTPNTDHGMISRPTFTVSGVSAGDVIRLYQDDDTCNSTAVASGTVGAGQTSINLQLINALNVEDETYTFYADVENSAAHRSACTEGIDYEFQKLICPDNYIPVLGNSEIGTDQFCVAKYEMKCTGNTDGSLCSGSAVSKPEGTPWVNIRANDTNGVGAWTACNNLNGVEIGTYALISNLEWMTIARDLQTVPLNWNGGVVGTNGISGGNSNSPAALAGDVDTAPCTGTGGSCTDLTWHVNKRTHKLSNDSVIWDLSGNVWEWIDWNPNGTSYSNAETGCSGGWKEFSTTCEFLSATQYLPFPLYTSAQNFGNWVEGFGDAAMRGGFWNSGTYGAGIFKLNLTSTPVDESVGTGFRCVYRP